MKLLLILSCIASVWYIDYQTMEIEKKALQIENWPIFVTQDELDLERKKFEEKMKEYDKLLWF